MKTKNWIEIREKISKKLVRIVYNPYQKSSKEILRNWILPEEIKNCYCIKTY